MVQLGEFPQLYSETPTDSGREWEKLRWKSLGLLREATVPSTPPPPSPVRHRTQEILFVFSPTSPGKWLVQREKLSVRQVRKISTNVESNKLGQSWAALCHQWNSEQGLCLIHQPHFPTASIWRRGRGGSSFRANCLALLWPESRRKPGGKVLFIFTGLLPIS